MSNPNASHLPPEILDDVLDFLHDSPKTLQRFCLTSRSWVPRVRARLFVRVRFKTEDDVRAWKRTFPDPTRSPAHYTHNLVVHCPLRTRGLEEAGWLESFSHVVRLELRINVPCDPAVFFTLFHKFSPSVKSLRVTGIYLPHPHALHLVRSLTLLENLTLDGDRAVDWGRSPAIYPSNSPALVGTLKLDILERAEPIVRPLLDLPDHLHFRKLILTCHRDEDFRWGEKLMAAYSGTLKCLDITHRLSDDPILDSIDLSTATKLRDIIFRSGSLNVDWITSALQSVTSDHQDLRQITIYIHYGLSLVRDDGNIGQVVGGEIHEQWSELDCLLVHFWESRSIRSRLKRMIWWEEAGTIEDRYGCLLPEMTRRGIVDWVK